MNDLRHLRMFVLAGMIVLLGLSVASRGQSYSAEYVAGPPVMANTEEVALLSDDQLDQLLAPVALYPDSLLAQMLPASTYPMDIVLAAQWLKLHPNPDDADIDQQSWEPSVKALVHCPTVLQTMADNAEWTQTLGAAFANQPDDVMAAIQRLRLKAQEVGNLTNMPQMQVVADDDVILIMPANPDVLYVPYYDPAIVYIQYVDRRPILLRARCATGRWLDNDCDWHDRRVVTGGGWHYGWQFEDQKWRHDDRRVDVHSVNARPIAPTIRPWSRNETKKRPTLPPAMLARDTVQDHRGWPPKVETPAANQRPADRHFALPTPARLGAAAASPVANPSQVKPKPLPIQPPPTAEALGSTSSGLQVQQAVERTRLSRGVQTPITNVPGRQGFPSANPSTPQAYTPPSAQPITPTPTPLPMPTPPKTYTPSPAQPPTPRSSTPPPPPPPQVSTPPAAPPRTYTPPPAQPIAPPPPPPQVSTPPAAPPRTYTPPPAQPVAPPPQPPQVSTPPAPPAISPDANWDTRAQSDRGHSSSRH